MPPPSPFLSWEAWQNDVFQLMLDRYGHIFGEPPITRAEVEWQKWRPWYEAGLSAQEAIEKSLLTD